MPDNSLLNELINSLSCLPGVGKKTAQRMAYHLLDSDRQGGITLASSLNEAMLKIKNCSFCRDYTEQDKCQLCQNYKRDSAVLCIVESPSDVLAIESTASFFGRYFVLLGQLSPLDGIGPEELGINQLSNRLKEGEIKEVIVATSSTIEGETTAHYIAQLVKSIETEVNTLIKVSRLAQGVPMGGELGYIDQSTLSLSLANRQLI